MTDKVFKAFLAGQTAQLQALAADSDIFELGMVVETLFGLTFHCRGLIETEEGEIIEHDLFNVVLNVDPDYLRKPVDDPRLMVSMVETNTFHPNIAGHVICLGKINAATPLTALVTQIYEILSYQKYNTVEYDALNPKACAWARENQHRLPIDDRSLIRRPQ